MKSVLLISNQHPNENGIGNPIMYRMEQALLRNKRVSKVKFVPFFNNLKSLWRIRHTASDFDIIHIHFGGLYALIIRIILIGIAKPMFITFHGTDIHAKSLQSAKSRLLRWKIILNQKASFMSIRLFDRCGFVSESMLDYIPQNIKKKYNHKFFIQSLGVDYNTFTISSKEKAQDDLHFPRGKYILFSDVSNSSIKRRDLAEAIVAHLGTHYKLLVMCGVKPSDVPTYINASDLVLLTSDEEGSPNIIREALALNKPFFSVKVGDPAKQLEGLENSTIISRNPIEAANTIKEYMSKEYVDFTRTKLQDVLDFNIINERIIDLYEQL